MGENEKCSWDDRKQALNIENQGYDFADLEEVFDGRFVLTRQDNRVDYGELRYNMLVDYNGRVINVTLYPDSSSIRKKACRAAVLGFDSLA